MTVTLRLGEANPMRHRARLATVAQDVARAQALRHLCLIEARGRAPRPGRIDADPQDALGQHVLIEDRSGALAGCLRLRAHKGSAALAEGDAARLYDLSPLAALPETVVEIGYFCIHPEAPQPEVLRVAWAAIADLSDRAKAKGLLALCPFEGTDPAPYAQAFALLRADHVAPAEWLPARRAADPVPLASLDRRPDRIAALRTLPPFLRSFLGLGAWVSDHAVPDPGTDTLQLLAILDPARMPLARAKALRALAPPLG